ncbi:hypothetical protein BH11PSE3_BH11PSE3_47820 [soil metagenome]
MPSSPPAAAAFLPASTVLQRLHDSAPTDYVTLGWLLHSLSQRSFGVVMLLLALVAMAPGIAIVAGLLLMIPAVEMMAGRTAPSFPRRLAERPFPTRHLAVLVQRAVPVLTGLEKMVHPRGQHLLAAARRLVGLVVVLLALIVVVSPIPFTSIPPALVIATLSLAYLEEDGVLLVIGLLAAAGVLAIVGVLAWETIAGVHWLGRLW